MKATGLTSNPSIFDAAIESGGYDDAIRARPATDLSDEELFFELAIEDLRRAADLFLPIHERTDGIDGWVSLEVSPLLAYDTARTIAAAKTLHARAGRPNLLIKIPGTVQRRTSAAAAVGEHPHQGPRSLRHALRARVGRAVHHRMERPGEEDLRRPKKI